MELDIFVYVAHLESAAVDIHELTRQLFEELDWGCVSSKIWIIVPDSAETPGAPHKCVQFVQASDATATFRARCREIESDPHDILVCFGGFLPQLDVISRLRLSLRHNGMVSAAVPRTAIEPAGHLVMLGCQNDGDRGAVIDRRQSVLLPPVYHMPEDLFPCLCLNERVVGNIDPPSDCLHFPDLVLAFLRAARRRGFLLLMDNTAVMGVPHYAFDSRTILNETIRVQGNSIEGGSTKYQWVSHPALAAERRLRVSASARNSKALLLDCRGLGPRHNGTAECALGILRGVHLSLNAQWDVAAAMSEGAKEFFQLDGLYRNIRFVSPSDDDEYDVAIHMEQAWSLTTVLDLSRRARSVAAIILDVIGPDIIYTAPDGSDEAFQFLGEHADGLIYISEFSRQQFHRRYYTRPDLIESVIHLSLDPCEYADRPEATWELDNGAWILIFGNSYDHKDLVRTVDILATAFPFEKIKVVGFRGANLGNVEGVESGELDQRTIVGLYAGAKLVVFPSFYEGFGFPLLRGLAYRKTVVARKSELLHEIAGVAPEQGTLIEYSNSLDLVPIVASLLAGGSVSALPLGQDRAAKAKSYGWASCGAKVLEFCSLLAGMEDPARWAARDRSLRYAFAPR